MVQYESLKDYINENKKDVILNKANAYIQSNNCSRNDILKDISILSLRCNNLPSMETKISMDVSAKVVDADSNDTNSRFYCITIIGNVISGFSNMTIDFIREIDETEVQEDKIVSLFGLPDISKDDLEEKALEVHSELYAQTCSYNKYKYRFNPIKIKEKYKKTDNMSMWPADLPDDCMGRLYLKPSKATIYNIENMDEPFPNTYIPANSILLNSKYYKNKMSSYDDLIIAAHELVHWNLHRLYFNILQLIDGNYECMNCSAETIIFDETLSLKEKAYWYAEWQANELAIRVAMPKQLVEKAIAEYTSKLGYNLKKIRDKKTILKQLEKDFNIPKELVKKRLRQLGYDFVDGLLVTVDGQTYPAFTFPQGTLKENETFIIDRSNYEILLKENKEFAELINDRICVYTGYVVCLYDAKYIEPIVTGENLSFILTDYGHKHADKCCLIFKSYHECISKVYASTTGNYLCKLKDGAYSTENDNKLELTDEALEYLCMYEDITKENEIADKIIAEMKISNIDNFRDALRFLMKKKNKTISDMVDENYLKEETLKAYLANPEKRKNRIPNIENLMIICNKLNLERNLSIYLIHMADLTLENGNAKNKMYNFLLLITNASLQEWDKFLEKRGFPPLIKNKNK